MKRLFLSTIALLALVGAAQADVILDDKLSGTGDNVIFNSLVGNLAVGTFNGQHTGFVDFTDLSGNPLFTGAQNGNDIKISNTNNLQVDVFDLGANLIGTTTQVFSLKGTGDVTAFITAVEPDGSTKLFTFDLGAIDPNAQSGFTFQSINGEVMDRMVLLDVGGQINDYEHYRIDAALIPQTPAVPELSTWAMMLLGFAGVGLFGMRRQSFRFA